MKDLKFWWKKERRGEKEEQQKTRTLSGRAVLGLGVKKETRVQYAPENRVQVDFSRCIDGAVGLVQNVHTESTFLIALSEKS